MASSDTRPDSASTSQGSVQGHKALSIEKMDKEFGDPLEALPTQQDEPDGDGQMHKRKSASKHEDQKRTYVKELWKFHMRATDDDDQKYLYFLGFVWSRVMLTFEQRDWWFASTAIPLLAATTGPLANVMSIAALVTAWRNDYDPAYPGIDDASIPYADPRW